jgi:hypothetical protein
MRCWITLEFEEERITLEYVNEEDINEGDLKKGISATLWLINSTLIRPG